MTSFLLSLVETQSQASMVRDEHYANREGGREGRREGGRERAAVAKLDLELLARGLASPLLHTWSGSDWTLELVWNGGSRAGYVLTFLLCKAHCIAFGPI